MMKTREVGNGRLLTPAEVTRLSWMPQPRGKPVHVSTVHRWIQRGIHGIRLRATPVGTTLCIAEADLRRFFEEIAEVRGLR